jgi:hypothetical protein
LHTIVNRHHHVRAHFGLVTSALLLIGLFAGTAHAQQPSAQLIVDALKAAGVQVGEPSGIHPDSGAPALCDGLQFELQQLGADAYGYAYACAALPDQRKVAAFWLRARFRVTQSGVYVLALPKTLALRAARPYQNAFVRAAKPLQPKAVAQVTRVPKSVVQVEATAVPPPAAAVAASTGAGVAPVDAWNCPASHPFKGNRNSMIYHPPNGRYYAKTKPEECFATANDAVAAGYRAPKR